MDTTLLIFLLVYVALAIGHLPGFLVDRTGAAVIGAFAMIATARITDGQAWAAIDYRTIALLFGLMVVSGGFTVSGFYGWLAARVALLRVGPATLLALLVLTGGVLSALLTNDVVVVAMTPLLVSITLSRGLNPVPFLLGFCFAANTGSAATIIGSPQNMIVAQTLGLSFNGFLAAAFVPAALSLPLVWGVIALLYRGRWMRPPSAEAPVKASVPRLDKAETIKALVVTLAVIVIFVTTDWPRDLVALAAAAVMLLNRTIASKDVLKTVDGGLLLLLMGLFVVNAAFTETQLPQKAIAALAASGFDLAQPMVLLGVVSVISNIVGNNPAVMLVTPFLSHAANPLAIGAALSLGTGFSSNFVIFGSLAGIIVVEQAAARHVRIGAAEFCRAGLPVTLVSLALAAAWVALMQG